MSTSDEPWTIGRLLMWTVDYLKKHDAENPRLDAEVLLAQARGCQRIDLYAAYGDEASDELRARFRDYVGRRAKGTPVAYIVGHKEFYSLDFEVTPDVLVPRPETESLVVALLDFAKERADGPISIADVGTGSGIIAICAAKFLPNSQVTAIDVSPAALAVARRNVERHGITDRVAVVESNLFAAVPPDARFDVVASNPPYVSTSEMEALPADVRDHEPHLALAAGERGTSVIEPLISQSAERLNPGGLLLIEISPMIARNVEDLVRASEHFTLSPTLRDAAGYDRIIQAMHNS